MWVAVLAPPDPIPSNTCRDIAASWGRITARHQGAVDRYKASGAALFTAGPRAGTRARAARAW